MNNPEPIEPTDGDIRLAAPGEDGSDIFGDSVARAVPTDDQVAIFNQQATEAGWDMTHEEARELMELALSTHLKEQADER